MYQEKKCNICGKTFIPNSPTQKYCSKECWYLIKNNNRNKFTREELTDIPNRICLICNTEFTVNPKNIKKKYCSKSCRQKAERVFGNKSETDLQYKDQIRFGGNKYKVLERDNYKCQICGNQFQLIVHHKDNSGQSNDINNDIDNLITLCRRCHVNIHKVLQ